MPIGSHATDGLISKYSQTFRTRSCPRSQWSFLEVICPPFTPDPSFRVFHQCLSPDFAFHKKTDGSDCATGETSLSVALCFALYDITFLLECAHMEKQPDVRLCSGWTIPEIKWMSLFSAGFRQAVEVTDSHNRPKTSPLFWVQSVRRICPLCMRPLQGVHTSHIMFVSHFSDDRSIVGMLLYSDAVVLNAPLAHSTGGDHGSCTCVVDEACFC